MTELAGTAEILRRLVAREGVPGGIPAMTPHRALRVAVNKGSQAVDGAGLRLVSYSEGMTSLTEVGQTLDPAAALFRLASGPDCLGLLAVDPAVVHAIVTVRMTGTLGEAELPTRPVTKIDGVVAQPVLARILAEFSVALSGLEAERYLAGQRLGDVLTDKRGALLELEDVPYRQFAGQISVGGALGSGRIAFVVPASAGSVAAPAGRHDADWQRKLEATVQTAEAQLEARLDPVLLGIPELRALSVGSEIMLPTEALNRIRILTLEGTTIAHGRLGQMSGNRAIRIGSVRH